MAGTLGLSAYLDVPGYLRAPAGQETASLLGLNTTLGGAGTIAAGTTTLPVTSSTGWAAGTLWMLDGPYSETVQVTGSPDGTHLSLAAPGTAFAHAAGVSASQAGSGGSLAEALLRSSAWIENYCQQGSAATDRSLYGVSRSERWGMPGARAWLDGDDVLAVRPGHFPVQSVASLSVTLPDGTALSLDVSQAELVSSGRLIELPLTLLSGSYPLLPGSTSGPLLSRSRRQWVSLTYTGGLTVGAVPFDVEQACAWVTGELLAERRNPWGAARVRQGKFELEARLRGDATGDSILLMQAKAILEPYRART